MAMTNMNEVAASLPIPAIASAEACYELGLLHASGRSGRVDLVAAQTWFNIAMARGCGRAAEHRRELATEMTREELDQALREARSYLTKH